MTHYSDERVLAELKKRLSKGLCGDIRSVRGGLLWMDFGGRHTSSEEEEELLELWGPPVGPSSPEGCCQWGNGGTDGMQACSHIDMLIDIDIDIDIYIDIDIDIDIGTDRRSGYFRSPLHTPPCASTQFTAWIRPRPFPVGACT